MFAKLWINWPQLPKESKVIKPEPKLYRPSFQHTKMTTMIHLLDSAIMIGVPTSVIPANTNNMDQLCDHLRSLYLSGGDLKFDSYQFGLALHGIVRNLPDHDIPIIKKLPLLQWYQL